MPCSRMGQLVPELNVMERITFAVLQQSLDLLHNFQRTLNHLLGAFVTYFVVDVCVCICQDVLQAGVMFECVFIL